MSRSQNLLAITPGEPAGIGPEVLLKLALERPDLPLLAVADSALLQRTAAELKLPVSIQRWQTGQPWPTSAGPAGNLACWHVPLAHPEIAGKPNPANAAYVLETLRQAVALLRSGQAGAMVTGPVNKAVINLAGIPFSGHTEFLQELAGVKQVVMMLAAPALRVVLVTTHLPLRQVADAINAENVERCIRITAQELQLKFGIARPRLQVLGLNPHAGEGGHLGSEDDAIIAPAIERCQADGIAAYGPIPADTAFNPPRLQQCDAVVAMYHDQGLPVLKHAGFGQSVNVTLGLPFIRTSVDHGTALDIAGQGIANASSLQQAALMALAMIRDCGGLAASGPLH